MRVLRELCLRYTQLGEEDIQCLLRLEEHLGLISELANLDVFLDCKLDERTAIVVAHARPGQGNSVYEKNVVGEYALEEKEPAVFHAFQVGMPVCDLKAITQEGRAVRQNVVPVRNKKNDVIAVLIREKDISSDLLWDQKFEELARSYEENAASIRQMDLDQRPESMAIREIHHRVKNNLQLVASILNLQARESKDPVVQAILRENVNRVLSISAIHDILNQSDKDVQMVSSKILLERLSRNLRELPPKSQHVRLTVEGAEVFLNIDVATCVSLVITELVTNAFKHAFVGRASGGVHISVCAGNLFHTVTVSDDGIGFDPAAKASSGLGMSIVRATVEDKLKGKLRIDSDKCGTRVSFDFRRE